MFREKYKEELNKMVLDTTFKENLAQKMREKQIELQQHPEAERKTKSKKSLIFRFSEGAQGRKLSFLPMVASICIVSLVCIGTLRMMSGSKSDNSTEIKYSTSSDSNTSSRQDASYGVADSDNSGAAEAETEALESAKESSDSANMIIAGSLSEEEAKSTGQETTEEKIDSLGQEASQDSNFTTGTTADTTFAGSIEYGVMEEFIPTPSVELETSLLHIMEQDRGSNNAILDYASWERIILHEDWGLIVFDLTTQNIIRAVDFIDKLSLTDTDKDYELQVLSGGNYLTIKVPTRTNGIESDTANEDMIYLYNIQTDEWLKMTIGEYEATNPPAYVDNIITSKDHDGGIFNTVDTSSESVFLDERTFCTLFYQIPDMKSIASLSIYLADIPAETETIYPIFGKYGLEKMEEFGK